MSLTYSNGKTNGRDKIPPHNTYSPDTDILAVAAGRLLPAGAVILWDSTKANPPGWADYGQTGPGTLKYIIKQ